MGSNCGDVTWRIFDPVMSEINVGVSGNKKKNGLLFIAVINKMWRGSFARDATDFYRIERKQFLFGNLCPNRFFRIVSEVCDNNKILRVLEFWGKLYICI